MTTTSFKGNIEGSFLSLQYISKEVAYEQMSKVGSDVTKSIRRAFISNKTPMEVVVNGGVASVIETNTLHPLGIRTSHSDGGAANGASNMYQFVQNFLMEKHGTLVVGGAFPSHVPLKRRNGKVVGTLGRIGGVSKEAIAILHRLDTGMENSDYPSRSKLLDEKLAPRNFMKKGIGVVQGLVQHRLSQGYSMVLKEAINNSPVKEETRVLA